jgi:murein DD-endopeptidase MepM/ murein hydrolase activator NlpD
VTGLPRRRQTVALLACLSVLLQPVVAASGPNRRRSVKRPGKTVRPPKPAVQPEPVAETLDGSHEQHVHVRRGDTLRSLLVARGVGPREAALWIAAAEEVYDLRRLRPKRGITFRFDRITRRLDAIHYEIDARELLLVERTADGIRAERSRLPYFTEIKGIAGRIERGLAADAADAGVPPPVVSELADIFAWELDLASDLRRGDEFRLLYENTWQIGSLRPEPGKVLGAVVMTRGRPIAAVFFEDAEGHGGYYRPSGKPLSRRFLRYPVEFTEITSPFSLLRPHPILRGARPHLGVDFAAPRGTPVRAVADGTVSYSGPLGELGRCVRIDHPNALASAYGHLARIAAGIRPGQTVERGQVIGYVGATGLATGPHLHFAMHRDGEHVDPLALTAEADADLPALDRRAFERVQAAVIRQLTALPLTARPLTVSLSSESSTHTE